LDSYYGAPKRERKPKISFRPVFLRGAEQMSTCRRYQIARRPPTRLRGQAAIPWDRRHWRCNGDRTQFSDFAYLRQSRHNAVVNCALNALRTIERHAAFAQNYSVLYPNFSEPDSGATIDPRQPAPDPFLLRPSNLPTSQ
jgi:hypothetical protein